MKPGSTSGACVALIRRDLAVVWRRRGDALNPILFALIVVALFPLALGPEPEVLRRIAAGVVFVALLLSGLLALDSLFRGDYEDGSLEQLEEVLDVLNKNEDNLDDTLRLMAPFYRVFANTLGNGPWFDTYIPNLPPVPDLLNGGGIG